MASIDLILWLNARFLKRLLGGVQYQTNKRMEKIKTGNAVSFKMTIVLEKTYEAKTLEQFSLWEIGIVFHHLSHEASFCWNIKTCIVSWCIVCGFLWKWIFISYRQKHKCMFVFLPYIYFSDKSIRILIVALVLFHTIIKIKIYIISSIHWFYIIL